MTYKQVLDELHKLANPEKVAFKKKKFGIVAADAIGVYHADLKVLAKEIGPDNGLALQLFDSGIFEGRLLCSKIFKPADVTEELMETWIPTFENWEICDSFSMGLFSKSPFAVKKIREWSSREREFEKRAAFATLSSYCMADKKSGNELFLSFLPMIERESTDKRLYVKKAVNWALRSIGKRNIDLNRAAIDLSKNLLEKSSKAANWIAKDALRELKKDGVKILDYPRAIYRV